MDTDMREYQRKTGKYILPGNMYMQTIYQIRDYYRLKEEAERILEESADPPDGQPKSKSEVSDPERKAMRRERMLHIIEIIDDAKAIIPEEYRKGVWDNVMHRTAFPTDADRVTYGRYKSLFVYTIAREIFFLD